MPESSTIQEFQAWAWEKPDGSYAVVDTKVNHATYARRIQKVGLYPTRRMAVGHNRAGRPVKVLVTIAKAAP